MPGMTQIYIVFLSIQPPSYVLSISHQDLLVLQVDTICVLPQLLPQICSLLRKRNNTGLEFGLPLLATTPCSMVVGVGVPSEACNTAGSVVYLVGCIVVVGLIMTRTLPRVQAVLFCTCFWFCTNQWQQVSFHKHSWYPGGDEWSIRLTLGYSTGNNVLCLSNHFQKYT